MRESTNRTRELLGHALTLVLVICALGTTAAMVRREFFAPTAPIPENRPSRSLVLSATDAQELQGSGQLVGEATAPAKIVVFSDFECPFCRQLDASLRELRRRHPHGVAILFRHFPLPTHARALPTAIAAECAAAQGRFDQFAMLAFESQDSLMRTPLEDLARSAGVRDLAAFRRCRSNKATADVVQRDVKIGQRLHISGTPALIVGDQIRIGAWPLDSLEAWFAATKQVATVPR